MTTAAARLVLLAGASGPAGALLRLLGAGASAGQTLVDYSGLASATAAEHLLEDVDQAPMPLGLPAAPGLYIRRRRRRDDDAVLMLVGAL